MGFRFRADNRDRLWRALEGKIQKRAGRKDKALVLKGRWKRFLRDQDGFRIYSVDGEWVRDNLSVIFEHGGHGFVHEFIPLREIWVADRHPPDCSCENIRAGGKPTNDGPGAKVSKGFFDSTVSHEIFEHKRMAKGMPYWKAHQLALENDTKEGIIEFDVSDYL